jgi:hypothetical protein
MSNINTLPLGSFFSVKSQRTAEVYIVSRRPSESEIPCELRVKDSTPGVTRTPDLLIRCQTLVLCGNHHPKKSP